MNSQRVSVSFNLSEKKHRPRMKRVLYHFILCLSSTTSRLQCAPPHHRFNNSPCRTDRHVHMSSALVLFSCLFSPLPYLFYIIYQLPNGGGAFHQKTKKVRVEFTNKFNFKFQFKINMIHNSNSISTSEIGWCPLTSDHPNIGPQKVDVQ